MLTDIQLTEAEELFESKESASGFSFQQISRFDKLKEFLTRKKYSQSFEDCWMFHDGKKIDQKRFTQARKVEDEVDLNIFLETMDKSFQKNDTQNPYGELGEYLDLAKKTWLSDHSSQRIQYFVFYKNETPVAVSSLTKYKKLGYISNVGSLKSVRGEGFGKLAVLYAVNESVLQGNAYHFLGTEEGNYPYEFYKRIGFINRFRAIGWRDA